MCGDGVFTEDCRCPAGSVGIITEVIRATNYERTNNYTCMILWDPPADWVPEAHWGMPEDTKHHQLTGWWWELSPTLRCAECNSEVLEDDYLCALCREVHGLCRV